MKFKLDENLPVSSAAILTSGGHDVDTVADEGLIGVPDRDVVAAATAAGRILISLDRGLGDIRAYPPGSHAGIVVLRLTDQSAAAATSSSFLDKLILFLFPLVGGCAGLGWRITYITVTGGIGGPVSVSVAGQGREAIGLAFQGAGRVVPACWAAWPQEREPEQGGQAPELEQPACLRRGQVEQGQEGVRVQVGA